MRENAKGYLSKAHLYVPQHDDRETPSHHKNELFKKMIIKERKEESDSSDFSDSSRKLYDDTEEDLRSKRETQSSFKKSFQPANFGEYIEFKINQFFDSSNVASKKITPGKKGASPGLKKQNTARIA